LIDRSIGVTSLSAAPTPRELERLAAFLAAPERPEGTLRLGELQGFLFAVVCAPELITPSEWLPLIFDDGEAAYRDVAEAKEMTSAIMAVYNDIARQVRIDHTPRLPFELRRPAIANFEPGAPLQQWSRGFSYGHSWLEELWDAYIPESLDQEFGSTLMVLSFFSDRHIAEALHGETKSRQSLEEMAELLGGLIEDAMLGYAQMGRAIEQALALEEDERREPAHSDKIGRNEPCPCGSGKKYKKCCGAAGAG
jgi:uncharacterized protein